MFLGPSFMALIILKESKVVTSMPASPEGRILLLHLLYKAHLTQYMY
ncbi:hypothetical protein [Pantoea sp. Nvir]|nr:hypothetical protein [Pantoea sp. Nvir]